MRSTVQSRPPNYQKYKTQRESTQRQKNIKQFYALINKISLTDTATLKLLAKNIKLKLLQLSGKIILNHIKIHALGKFVKQAAGG